MGDAPPSPEAPSAPDSPDAPSASKAPKSPKPPKAPATDGPTQPSGSGWVSKFPGSASVGDLDKTFGANVQKFIDAIEAGGAKVTITSTYRPPQRAYLMHWSWKIVKENYDAQKVPRMSGVDINWWHGNQDDSKKAAQEMVDGYGINNLKVAPALSSNHIRRKAIDMHVTWKKDLKIKQADGTEKTIDSTPRDETNSDLIDVGGTYDVIHLTPVKKDKVHWSVNGR